MKYKTAEQQSPKCPSPKRAQNVSVGLPHSYLLSLFRPSKEGIRNAMSVPIKRSESSYQTLREFLSNAPRVLIKRSESSYQTLREFLLNANKTLPSPSSGVNSAQQRHEALIIWKLNDSSATEGMEMIAHDGMQGAEGFIARAMAGEEMSVRIGCQQTMG